MYYKKKRGRKKGRRSRNKGGGKKRIKIINLGLKSQLSEKSACHVGMIPRSREKIQMLGITLVQENDSCGSQSVLKKTIGIQRMLTAGNIVFPREEYTYCSVQDQMVSPENMLRSSIVETDQVAFMYLRKYICIKYISLNIYI